MEGNIEKISCDQEGMVITNTAINKCSKRTITSSNTQQKSKEKSRKISSIENDELFEENESISQTLESLLENPPSANKTYLSLLKTNSCKSKFYTPNPFAPLSIEDEPTHEENQPAKIY